jgi:hypothetical protein
MWCVEFLYNIVYWHLEWKNGQFWEADNCSAGKHLKYL